MINVDVKGTSAKQKESQSSGKKIMKTPTSPLEKRKLSYNTKTSKDVKAPAKK
jgi:hypothetical protein